MQILAFFSTLPLIFASLLVANSHDDISRCQKLHDAVDRMELSVVVKLAKKVEANCRNSEGQTALHRYAQLPNPDQIFFGLYYFGHHTLDANDNKGMTPLMVAAANGNVINTQTLLAFATTDNPINLDAHDHEGLTPLHHAVLAKNSNIVEILLQKGSSALLMDSCGLSALMRAKQLKDKKNVKLLKKAVKLQHRANKKCWTITSKQK